ncbi:hypothetical protein [Acinetobacter ursingii]|uniref:hypothetical protein n=1 Tax=Acinetobacter ursingii TaxID=108980 RepID=UPI00254A54FA|nr:hypothetical protein [Acinetobacter ursingii]MEC6128325.1 hypothetical protein [Acinetobacter ursingii]
MTDLILHSSLNVLKVLNQLKDVQPVQCGTLRQFNTLTFTFKYSGHGLEKSIIVYMKDSGFMDQKIIKIAQFETTVKVPLSAIEVIQFKYGNTDYAAYYSTSPNDLFHMELDQVEAYCADVFGKLQTQYLLDLEQPRTAI